MIETNSTIHYPKFEEKDIVQALDEEQFFLEYQPRVNTKTNAIVGFEALIRWNHPTYGIVAPKYFIPFAEQSELIVPIGNWVMEQVCHTCKLWEKRGYDDLFFSINLSLKQFMDDSFVMQVGKIFESYAVNPKQIEFEVTETMMFQDMNVTIDILKQLKEFGARISIDDFGTGYSSFTHLKYLPIDILKIDRSFIKDVPEGVKDAAITSTVIALGKHLQLVVVAEGVEKQEQLDFLIKENCHEYQGFLFSKPIKNIETLMIK